MRFQLPLALLLSIPAATACTSDATTPPDDSSISMASPRLRAEDGGYDTTDEAPEFGRRRRCSPPPTSRPTPPWPTRWPETR